MAIFALNDVRPNLLYAPAKVCAPAPDFSEVPPIVQFFSESSPKVSAGLGVMIADNWILTCEHIIAGGAPHYCDALNDQQSNKIRIRGGFIEGSSTFVAVDRFSDILGYRKGIDSYQERLALVFVEHDGVQRKKASPFVTQMPSEVTLWASNGLPEISPGCSLAKVKFTSFSRLRKTRCWLTEEFSNANDAVVEGDSGGGFFTDNAFGFQLVAIQNASAKVRFRDTAVALGIPVQPAASWINSVIADG